MPARGGGGCVAREFAPVGLHPPGPARRTCGCACLRRAAAATPREPAYNDARWEVLVEAHGKVTTMLIDTAWLNATAHTAVLDAPGFTRPGAHDAAWLPAECVPLASDEDEDDEDDFYDDDYEDDDYEEEDLDDFDDEDEESDDFEDEDDDDL